MCVVKGLAELEVHKQIEIMLFFIVKKRNKIPFSSLCSGCVAKGHSHTSEWDGMVQHCGEMLVTARR